MWATPLLPGDNHLLTVYAVAGDRAPSKGRLGDDLHAKLPHGPLAPSLHCCARVIGEIYMVVMEYIPKSRGQSTSLGLAPWVPEVVYQDVVKALGLLHKVFVFGDLRETNLYLPEDGGRMLLVEFNGVGMDGEDRYSACLDPAVKWA